MDKITGTRHYFSINGKIDLTYWVQEEQPSKEIFNEKLAMFAKYVAEQHPNDEIKQVKCYIIKTDEGDALVDGTPLLAY